MASLTSKKTWLFSETFRIIAHNWRIFLPLWLISSVLAGAISFMSGSIDGNVILGALLVSFIWLVALYATRRIVAGKTVSFREAIFNGLGPLASEFVVVVIILIHMLPLALIPILYNSAIQTDFLSLPGQVIIFILIVIALITLSVYLLSGSLMALVAASVPGMYPITAMRATYAMMKGKRLKFLTASLILLMVMTLVCFLALLPFVGISFATYSVDWIFAPTMLIGIIIMGCFTIIYMAVYLYLFYIKSIDSK